MSRRASAGRGVGVATAVVLSVLSVSGCSRPVPVRPVASQCAIHQQQRCQDVIPVAVRHPGMSLFSQDPPAAVNEACAALSDAERDRILGQPTYAVVQSGGSPRCVVESDAPASVDADGQLTAPQQVRATIGLFPQAVRDYNIVPGNRPASIAGHPAWRNDTPTLGQASRQYTVATGSRPDAGGVLLITVGVDQPRGSGQIDKPVDPAPLQAAEPLAAAVLSHLGMNP